MSLHADALAALTAWDPGPGRQRELRDRYVAHLRAQPDGMTRSSYPDHLTASTLVLSASGDHVLLTLHAKARRWFQLGGHCEPADATLARAAAREAAEESGITDLVHDPVPVQLSEHAVPFCDPRGGVHHLDVRYVAVAQADALLVVSQESLDVRWWPADALPDPQPDLVELVNLARARAQSTSSSPSAPGGGSSWAANDQPDR
ncbi:MAG: NUDIX domain-containing protein [Nocardioides sp.]